MIPIEKIHEQNHSAAMVAAKQFKKAEAALILSLQAVDSARTYLRLGYTSLSNYVVNGLKLSESVAANFVTVARKAEQMPALQLAIQDGLLSVSKARKVTPVLTSENQEHWVRKAVELSQYQLEEEVARVVPRLAIQERMKTVSEDRVELQLGISKRLRDDLRQVQDLESQRTKRSVSLEETLEALARLYLDAKDPVRRAKRVFRRINATAPVARQVPVTMGIPNSEDVPSPIEALPNEEPISAQLRHEVNMRDQRTCGYTDSDGNRCSNKRWLDIHHIKPRSRGGDNTLENLITLCWAHHKMQHEKWVS